MGDERPPPDVSKVVELMRQGLRQHDAGTTRAKGSLAVMCPYCGAALQVSERDMTALTVSTAVDDVPRIDASFLAKHRCRTP